jgi:hypothetical protein
MTDEGLAQEFLWVRMFQGAGTVILDQQHYCETIVRDFTTPPAHRTGLFRPTNAFQMPSVGVPASLWVWAKARS